jgi:site-specific DNA recombinase
LSEDDRSTARQVEHARAFALARGWHVADEHVYVDDGVSGAAMLSELRGKARLLAAIENGPPFGVLIVQAADRLSRRDGDEAFSELKRIAKAGVQVWFYSDGTRFDYGTFATNTLGFLRAEFAAEYRRSVALKTAEAMRRDAQRGHVTGGRVFGYDNVCAACGRLVPAGKLRCCPEGHTERRINEAEAEVVRRIFALSADGTGYTRIAKRLNADRVPSPRPQQHRPVGWAPTTIRDVLHRETYRGVLVYGRTKKRDVGGDIAPCPRPEAEWVQRPVEDLRIVSDAQWEAAHAALRGRQTGFATATGIWPVHRRDLDSRYLLAGFARCGRCGGTLSVLSRQHGKRASTSTGVWPMRSVDRRSATTRRCWRCRWWTRPCWAPSRPTPCGRR